VLFANFAEAVAEGRGKAQADALRRTRTDTVARRLLQPGTNAGETGIRTDPAFNGFRLKKSVFIANANGLYFHSSGLPESSVKTNCFRKSGLAGIRTRYGLADATISKNLFFRPPSPRRSSSTRMAPPPTVSGHRTRRR
jgi:hypothetical protein